MNRITIESIFYLKINKIEIKGETKKEFYFFQYF